MLTFGSGHARLVVQKDEPFTGVTESVRSLLQLCRLNRLTAALIVSEQVGFDFRSSVRIAFKFAASRPAPLPRIRVALVALAADDAMLGSVAEAVNGVGLICRGFRNEAQAMAWLGAESSDRGPGPSD